MAEPDGIEKKNQLFKTSDKGSSPAWWQPAILMFFRLSAWIAGPVIVALYLGSWLDKKYSSQPWLFLTCLAMAFFVSIYGLVRNTITEMKKLEKDNISKNQEKNK